MPCHKWRQPAQHTEAFLKALEAVEGITSVVLSMNKAKTNVILGYEIKVLQGPRLYY